MNTLERILENYPDEEILKADGFDDAVIGCDNDCRLIYSIKKCIDILIEEGMDEFEAYDYFYYNVSNAYVGEKTPIWCNDIL